jgi:hypothetical protein
MSETETKNPTLAHVVFHIQDPQAQAVGGAFLSAQSVNGPWQGITGADGNFAADLTPGHYDITITATGFKTDKLPADIKDPGTITRGLVFAGDSLPKLSAGRWDIFDATGARHVIAGSTELMLAWRYDLEGVEAIRPVLDQRRSCGFNDLRFLWQKGQGSNGLTAPWQMPTEKMRPFLALLAEYRFYGMGVILADCQAVNPNEVDQQTRVNSVRISTAGVTNHYEQLGNEYEKNGFNPAHFAKPTDRMAANASSIEGGKDAPYWDLFLFSGQRSPLNHAIREYGPIEFMYGDRATWGGLPASCDEGMKPGIDSTDPRDYERAGAQARSGIGGRFHSTAGTAGNCRLFDGLELACAQAFIKGLGLR